jgi:hypothetical protein
VKDTGDIYIKPVDFATREAIVKSKLSIIVQTPTKSKVLIYNVYSELTAEELIENLIRKNEDLKSTNVNQYNTISERTPFGQPSSRRVSWLVEVDPIIYRKLINMQYYIGMTYCRVQAHHQVPICFIYQRYGHIAKYCPTKVQKCARCSSQEKEHDGKNCTATPKCVNCGKNKPMYHLDCPSRLRATIQRCRKTDYVYNGRE